MPLIYAFVARDHTVLAEYTPYSGNFNTVAIECLVKLQNPESKFTIACDRHTFNFLLHNGFSKFSICADGAGCFPCACNQALTRGLFTGLSCAAYLVVADEAYGRQIPFSFLERVRDEFEEKYAEKGRTAPAHSMDRTFG
jgi:vesicle-associated membrane protein 72